MINITPKFPKKIQFLLGFEFPLIDNLLPRKEFIGGRIGYPIEEPLKILGVSHSGSTVSEITPSPAGLSSGEGIL